MSERPKPRKLSLLPTSPPAHPKPHRTLTLTSLKPPRRLVLAASLLLLSLYALYPSHSSPASPPFLAPKIYVYDLPPKFTSGVIHSYLAARSAGGPAPDLKYPGNQHSGEWYLFNDLNRPHRPLSPLARTFDPDSADLFYVPFFSSLSLVVNPIRPNIASAAPAYSDEAMQEELIEWLEAQEFWRRNGGRDHVFVCQDPNALNKVIDRVRNGVLLVSDFGRLGGGQASLVKDVILPYSHRINPYKGEVGVEGRSSLLFFMGNRYRKEVGFLHG